MTTQATATTAGSPGTSPHPRAPWSTVLPLAVVAAYGSGFWLIVIRGAVGAIERTQAPFATWLEESTLLLPLYVFAVIAALTLALRWFGRGPWRAREVALTLLLVAVGATLAATVVQAVSAVFDYRLQTTQVTNMAAHMPLCGVRCIAEQQHAGLVLQLHALGLGSFVMLVSNVVLLAFVVGLRGGRLDLVSSHRPQERGAGRVAHFDNVDRFLLATLLGAAAIHATVIRGHLTQWPLGGVAILLLMVAEVDAALLFLLRLRFMQVLGAAAVSAVPLALWLYAHTAGLPFGPHAGAIQPLGFTMFRLGGHSVLFYDEYRIGASLGPERADGFDVGGELNVPVGRIAVVVGYRYLGGPTGDVAVTPATIVNADQVVNEMSIAEMSRLFAPGPARVRTSASRFVIGVKTSSRCCGTFSTCSARSIMARFRISPPKRRRSSRRTAGRATCAN